MDLNTVTEHIEYLKEKTKHIKGLKINYHDKYVSQIEAVLTRGDVNLCRFIESLYNKGCYLDTWGEHFNKNVWIETAKECGFSLEEKAQQEYSLEQTLPWDFIDVGLNKEWLINEYNQAFSQGTEFNLQKTCENNCVNCGVCKNLKTKKVLAKPFVASGEAQKILNIEPIDPKRTNVDPNIPVYRYRLHITKKGLLKYFSHLDWQNTFHKVLARTGLNIAYTLGFNPTMKVSMGIALPLFAESEGELVDIEIYDNMPEAELMKIINKNLPNGAKITRVQQIERYSDAVDVIAYWAEYKISPYTKQDENFNYEKFKSDIQQLLNKDEILITKTGKQNGRKVEKLINVKQSIGTYKFDGHDLFIILKVGQSGSIPALRADDFVKTVSKNQLFNITRLRFLDEKLNTL